MPTSRLDARGRVTIQKAFRKHLRGRIVQILTPHGVLLRPVPDTLPDREDLPDALHSSGEDAALAEAGKHAARQADGPRDPGP